MNKILISLLLFGLSGCASSALFRKADSGEGYSVQDSPRREQFQVKVNLPADELDKFVFIYTMRAIGEECAARGFSYFSPGMIDQFNTFGFCFKEPKRKGIGISFAGAGKWKNHIPLLVNDVSLKPTTSLKLGDTVTKVDGKEISSVAFLQGEIHQAAREGKSKVTLNGFRAGKPFTVQEALIDADSEAMGLTFGPADLDDARKRVN